MADAMPHAIGPPSVADVEACRAELVDSGYTPIEVINADAAHGSPGKAPFRSGWQHGPPITETDPRALNTGIRCNGLRAVDIDVENPTIAARIKATAIELFGACPMRWRGNSARVLLLYRAAIGEPVKRTIASRTGLGKVEVLGHGQQFVAYGVHPSGASLQWEPEGPRAWAVDALPAVTEEGITEFFKVIAPMLGADAPDTFATDNGKGTSRHGQVGNLLRVLADLHDIPNDGAADWEAWNRVGMALWAATGGSAGGREAWHAWSGLHPSCDHARTEERWDHYPQSPPTEIGAGTIHHLAAEARLRRHDATGGKRFQLLTTTILAALPERGYLLKGIMAPGELSVWWGEPKCGKSFLAMHIAYALAQGRSVLGRRVRQCQVLYLACEGRSGLRGRVQALERRYGPATGFLALAEPIDLRGTGDTDALVEIIIAHRAALVVVDTLNRVIAGGDENSSADMGALIRNLDHIRARTGAHVMVIHHGTKSGGSTPRGHGSLIGAADAIIEVSADDEGNRKAAITDAKDDASGKAIAFHLEVVELGADDDGDMRTTCLVEELGETAARARSPKAMNEAQRGWLRDISDVVGGPDGRDCTPIPSMPSVRAVTRDQLRHGLKAKGRFALDAGGNMTQKDRSQLKDALQALADKGKIGKTDQYVWLL